MLKEFSLVFVLFVFCSVSFVFAIPYQWDSSEFNFVNKYDLTLSGNGEDGVLVDVNNDGYVDAIYEVFDSGSDTITLQKIWGDLGYDKGVFNLDTSTCGVSNADYDQGIDHISSNGEMITFTYSCSVGTLSHYAFTNAFNATDGTVEEDVVTGSEGCSSSCTFNGLFAFYDPNDDEVKMIFKAGYSVLGGRTHVVHEPNSVVAVSASTSANTVYHYGGIVSDNSLAYDFDGNDRGDVIGSIEVGSVFGVCNDDECWFDTGGTSDNIDKSVIDAYPNNLSLGYSIPYYNFGFQLPNSLPSSTEKWNEYLDSNLDDNEDFFHHLNYKILDGSLTKSPYRFSMQNYCENDDSLVFHATLSGHWETCNGYDYTVTGSAGFTNSTVKYDYMFDGDGSTYSVYSDTGSLGFDVNQPITISVITHDSVAGTKIVFAKTTTTGADAGFNVRQRTGDYLFALTDTDNCVLTHSITSVGNPNDGNPHMFTVTYNANGNGNGWTRYFDGSSVGIGSVQDYTGCLFDDPLDNLAIGATNGGTLPVTGGVLDVRIYDRELNSTEVANLWTNSTSFLKQIGYINDKTISYFPVDQDLTNRALGYYLVDDSPTEFSTQLITQDLSVKNFDVVTPTTTYNVNEYGALTLLSGYYGQGVGISRFAVPELTNSSSIIPYIVGTNSSQTTLTVNIKNAPSDFSVILYDSVEFNSVPYAWSIQRTTADKSFVVDLPNGKCVQVFGRDTSDLSNPWEDLGEVCANGVMPKQITYLSNLAFTFWTLPWGTSHSYTQDSTSLETMVRHETLPFSYYVNIYHANGTLANSTSFTETTTPLDTQTFNTTNVDLPAKLVITDSLNSTLYVANIGYPSYLSGVSAWFNEWFEIDGFNLLYMLPIIFAAMFTRNSVAIGSILTVGMIALLSWLGLIVVEEVIMYLLVFVAVVGMIAYRLVRG